MIYLDSAATSLYKPETVQYAVLEAMNNFASPGRGAHAAAMAAADCCFTCRERIAQLFHVPEPENVVFTFNATHGLNIAIRSLIKPGGKVLVSGYEHNAVTRPLHALGAQLIVIDTPLFDPQAFLREAQQHIREAEAVVCTHVSNVFGYILPIGELAELCRRYGKPLIIDASQSAGVLDLDFAMLGADFCAMPGHKGLLGPQGTGILLCKNDARPLLYGGSGSDSIRQTMPDYLPERLEAGTHNVTGIAGLSAGVKYVLERGCGDIRKSERRHLENFTAALRNMEGVRIFDSDDPTLQCGVVSLVPENITCEEFAARLDEAGIAVRTGLQCAPLAHRTAGTLETGTVRFSFSPFTTDAQISTASEVCKKILKNR